MKFRSDEVKDGFSMPAPGVYDAEVLDCKEKVSKAGNEMLELKLELDTVDGGYHIYDYLIPSKAMWKVGKMLNAFGVRTDEDVDFDPESLIGRQCKVKVKIENDAQYGDKCKVSEWVSALKDEGEVIETKPPKKKKTINQNKGVNDPTDEDGDDVPF